MELIVKHTWNTLGQTDRILGIQDQGMVVKKGHSYHEDQEVLRMLGENYLRCTYRNPGVTYGSVIGDTTQCREIFIYS